VIGAAALLWIISASVAAAQSKVLVRAATQTTFNQTAIGPSDIPVRMAVFTPADREQLKMQPAQWGRGWGAPYYAYYPAPSYYPAPYYPAPYYTYYAPPMYYSAAPGPYYNYYAPAYAPAPVVTYYRFPRRAFYGGYYW